MYKTDYQKINENKNRSLVFEKLQNDKDLLQRNKWKTIMCETFINTGKCKYGAYCMYAHSKEELRIPVCLFGEFCKKKNRGCKLDHTPNAVIPEIPKFGTVKKTPEEKAKKRKEREERRKNRPQFKVNLEDDEDLSSDDESVASSTSRAETPFEIILTSQVEQKIEEIKLDDDPEIIDTIKHVEALSFEDATNIIKQDNVKTLLQDYIRPITPSNIAPSIKENMFTHPIIKSLKRATPTFHEDDYIRDNYHDIKRLLRHVSQIKDETYKDNIELVDKEININIDSFEEKVKYMEETERLINKKRKKLLVIEVEEDDDYLETIDKIRQISKKIKVEQV